MLTVVTGYNLQGWEEYGRACAASYIRHWPLGVKHITYAECDLPVPGELRRAGEIPGWVQFQKTYGHRSAFRGETPYGGYGWKAKHIRNGYNFRYDAAKFSKMAMYAAHAAGTVTSGHLLWLDGDVRTVARVEEDWILQFLPIGYDLAYLGRAGYHTETGFLLCRMPAARSILSEWSRLYTSGEFEELSEWHSAFVFDHVLRGPAAKGCRTINIAGTPRDRYWEPLSSRLEHLKGKRKKEANL